MTNLGYQIHLSNQTWPFKETNSRIAKSYTNESVHSSHFSLGETKTPDGNYLNMGLFILAHCSS